MKNIRDIKSLDETIETLKELYIANMKQLAILENKVNKNNKEQVAKLEKELENEINTIIYSETLEVKQKIRYIRGAIESTYTLDDKNLAELEDIYISAMIQEAIASGRLNYNQENAIEEDEKSKNKNENMKEIDPNKVVVFEQQLEKNIEELIENAKTEDKKKEFLKIAIEDIHTVKDIDTKGKLESFSKGYLQKLMEISNTIKGISKDEKAILKIINQRGVRIHDDKDIDDMEDFNYGDLVKDRRIKPKLIFQNSDMIFKRLAQFNVGKSTRSKKNNNIISKIENENVNEYEFITLSNRGEMISLNFYGEDNLEQQLHDEKNYLPYILAAIAKAKEEGREHIGEITILDTELGTAVVKYDDKLEKRVKELRERNINQNNPKNQEQSRGNR